MKNITISYMDSMPNTIKRMININILKKHPKVLIVLLLVVILGVIVKITGVTQTEEKLTIENNLSPWFTINGNELLGEERTFGILDHPSLELKEEGFRADGESNVFEFYFWGSEGELIGEKYRLVATKESSNEEKTMYEQMITSNYSYEEIPSAQAQSGGRIAFDQSDAGIWLMEVYIDGRVFSSFSIEVKD
ncbi:hypothetical protein LF817_16160 [Halobacillus sp. A1]|uniref:hypothetical protein n=1 Tax=Halobacillus sp. A1 TaxID=2880262 RepID=UPI0020A6C897|nr:hypothetical protein [Halobacillus sp. A1]MCP3032861.1 hypothetical protein [Halobacillus sp. A1]